MRKQIISQPQRESPSANTSWLDLEALARVEVTSEDAAHPIESALLTVGAIGWRAESPGEQTVQLLERHAWLLFERACVGLIAFADTYGIDNNEVSLCLSVGRNGLEVGIGDDADAAAFHLFEEAPRFYRAHEHHDLERFDIGAGGDHIDSNGNARVRAIAESLNQL